MMSLRLGRSPLVAIIGMLAIEAGIPAHEVFDLSLIEFARRVDAARKRRAS